MSCVSDGSLLPESDFSTAYGPPGLKSTTHAIPAQYWREPCEKAKTILVTGPKRALPGFIIP